MSQSPTPPTSDLPPSLPPRGSSQDGRTRFLSPTVDPGGPRTVEIRRSSADTPHPPPARPSSAPPAAQPTIWQSTAVQPLTAQPAPGRPATGEGRDVEPPSGPTPEAAPVNPASGTARPSSRTWIGWLLALLVIVGAAGAAYAVYGLTPLFITTTVPLMVVGFGIGLLLLALLSAVGRRRRRLAVERARHEAQQQAWAGHQQFLRRLDHELKNPLTAVRAAVADLPQAHPQ